MDAFLKDLEAQLGKMSESQRAAVVGGLQKIVAGVEALGGKVAIRPMAAAGIMRELGFAMASGRPFRKTVEKFKAAATKIGPHVTALFHAF